MKIIRYIKEIFVGIWHLMEGLYVTMLNFVRPKVTEQYPENRGVKTYPAGFRALLTMPHDENNHHKCTACNICATNCPNGTLTVIGKMETDPVTGREKKVIDRYMYDLGSCIFCALCTTSCPFGAIEFSNAFEHSVYTKSKLLMQLNRPGSSLAPKPAPAAAPATPKPAAGNAPAGSTPTANNAPAAGNAPAVEKTPEAGKTAVESVPAKETAAAENNEGKENNEPKDGEATHKTA